MPGNEYFEHHESHDLFDGQDPPAPKPQTVETGPVSPGTIDAAIGEIAPQDLRLSSGGGYWNVSDVPLDAPDSGPEGGAEHFDGLKPLPIIPGVTGPRTTGDWPERSPLRDEGITRQGFQRTLDGLGFIPGVGAIFDGVNAIIHARHGEFVEAGLSAVSMVPIVGDAVGKGGKIGKAGIKVAKPVTGTPARVSGDALAEARKEFAAVRPEFWKNQARTNAAGYSPENLARMTQGKPPIGADGFPIELHHRIPLARGGTNAFENLIPLSRTDHRMGLNYRLNHPDLP